MPGHHLPLLILLAISSQIMGCALVVPDSYVSRKEVTLSQAMKDVACGLKTYQNESSRLDLNVGSIVDQAEVTLNLKASATGTSTLVVDTKTSGAVGIFAPIGVNYTDKLESVGSRDNSIKIIFKNIYTAGLNKAGEVKVKAQGPDFKAVTERGAPVTFPCNSRRKVFDNEFYEP